MSMPMALRIGAFLFACFAMVGCVSKNPYYDPDKPHHRPDGFVNSDGSGGGNRISVWESLQRRMRGDFQPAREPAGGYDKFAADWTAPLDPAALAAPPAGKRVTWLGHASVLLQLGAVNVLTDPVLSDFAGPTSWLGAKRRVPAPLDAEHLPRLNAILISHNHYDHLDLDTVRRIHAAQGDSPLWVVPLGLKKWFANEGIEHVVELDWWDHIDHAGVRITLTPSRHWSKRTLWDTNRSLWGGFMVERDGWRFLYSGDTGYTQDFVDIYRRLGAPDVFAVDIGAYQPRDFMRPQHIDPAEAVRIAQDVHAGLSIGIHWGTFELSNEPFDMPPQDLAAALHEAQIPSERFRVLKHGESIVIKD